MEEVPILNGRAKSNQRIGNEAVRLVPARINKPAPYNPLMFNADSQESSRAPGLRPSHLAAAAAFVLFGCLGAFAGKEFVMPAAQPGGTYPAHDDHPLEKVVVAVDPYDVEDKASIFTANYRNYGYMPVFFVITNDGDQPFSLVGMKVQLNTKDRSKLFPSTTEEVVRRLSHPSRNDRPNSLPIPLPKKEVKGGVSRKTWDEIDAAQFGAKAVEPHSTARGISIFRCCRHLESTWPARVSTLLECAIRRVMN